MNELTIAGLTSSQCAIAERIWLAQSLEEAMEIVSGGGGEAAVVWEMMTAALLDRDVHNVELATQVLDQFLL